VTGAVLISAWFFVGITVADHAVMIGRDLFGPFPDEFECRREGTRWAEAVPGRAFAASECFADDALALLRGGPLPVGEVHDLRAVVP
jgi:hypothetical protein